MRLLRSCARLMPRKFPHFAIVEAIRSGGRLIEAPQQIHQRCFAGTGHAHQRHELPLPDLKGHGLQDRHVALAQAVSLVDVLEFYQRHRQVGSGKWEVARGGPSHLPLLTSHFIS